MQKEIPGSWSLTGCGTSSSCFGGGAANPPPPAMISASATLRFQQQHLNKTQILTSITAVNTSKARKSFPTVQRQRNHVLFFYFYWVFFVQL